MRNGYESPTFNAPNVEVPLRGRRIELVVALSNEHLGRAPGVDTINLMADCPEFSPECKSRYVAMCSCYDFLGKMPAFGCGVGQTAAAIIWQEQRRKVAYTRPKLMLRSTESQDHLLMM
jgi:hypothetical protein